ncbi:hypothetical protein BDV38DRAFT_218338 [Aspergillus pseudotamarii]|uniref:Uncharacterized protein n=1 Tax=Aspergillus pseudotamarii TaxID=132259 RepID=A0A5N6T3U6_ASPPS|nr:uncharacterized protein BDV38DRAFT_218338 [Aspergillus pseudotamarii]KAE8140975.1 hypothetical protein BDV38DRAFT_218338 [Aspergillus pseudotamarii]
MISASESNKQPSSHTETTRNGAGSHFLPRLDYWHSASLSRGQSATVRPAVDQSARAGGFRSQRHF